MNETPKSEDNPVASVSPQVSNPPAGIEESDKHPSEQPDAQPMPPVPQNLPEESKRAIDKIISDAQAIIDWAAQVEKQGHVVPDAPATKADIDGLRDAVMALTEATKANGTQMGEVLTKLKAGRF